ncbi:FGGY family carbohydrate kinase [Paenibacillus algorifonticola]|uniref:FGGY family carbohydrate kinase n=1 Tax=Paenibacillus algorifonticola TaxID=684063 RepID=UPI003D2CC76A
MRGIHSVDYPLIYPRSLWVEQDPESLFQASITAIREVMRRLGAAANELIGIGISISIGISSPNHRCGDKCCPTCWDGSCLFQKVTRLLHWGQLS